MSATGFVDGIYALIGLARRARQVVDGQDRIVAAIANGSARLVIVTTDAGANGRKKLLDKSSFYGVPVVNFGTKLALGSSIGRREAAAVAVLEEGFATKLQSRIGETRGGGAFDENSSL